MSMILAPTSNLGVTVTLANANTLYNLATLIIAAVTGMDVASLSGKIVTIQASNANLGKIYVGDENVRSPGMAPGQNCAMELISGDSMTYSDGAGQYACPVTGIYLAADTASQLLNVGIR